MGVPWHEDVNLGLGTGGADVDKAVEVVFNVHHLAHLQVRPG
jgi:hypothetical protein